MKKKYYIASGVILVLVILAVLQVVNKRNDLKLNSQIRVEKLENEYLKFESTVVAKTECNDKTEIYAPEVFYVEDVLVKENDTVTKGEQLFRFSTQDYEEEILREEENKQMLEEQFAQEEEQEKSKLSELKQSLSTYQLTCNLAKNELDYQETALLQIREEYENDKDNKDDLVLLAAEKTYKEAEEKYKFALKQCDYVKKEIADYKDSENSNNKILEHKIELSELTIKQLQEKKQLIEKMQYADQSGMVAEIDISKGMYTTVCQKIYTLYDIEKLNLKIKTEEKFFGLISEGDSVTFHDDDTSFSLVIKEKQATNQNKIDDVVLNDTFYLIASLDKEQMEKFKIGDVRQYTMEFSSTEKGLLCSYSSLIREEENYYIFICDLDTQKIRKQKVEIGNLQEEKIEIIGDISEQDYIVKNPEESYYDGEIFTSVVKE